MPHAPLLLSALLLALPLAQSAESPRTYADVASFLHTYKDVETTPDEGVWGDLDGQGGLDWAGVVYFSGEDGRSMQVVLLTRGTDGRFVLSGSTEARSSDGGTGHYGIDDITIDKRSVFISSSWHWHGCYGHASHQYRQEKRQWHLIGAEFERSNALADGDNGYDTRDSASFSINYLSMRAEVEFTPYRHKKQVRKFKLKPLAKPFILEDYDPGLSPPEELPPYANC